MARLARFAVIATVLMFVGCSRDWTVHPTSPTSAVVVCEYTFSPSKVVASSLPQRVVVQVTTADTCPWVVTTTDSWMDIAYQGSSGTGDLIFNLDHNQCTSMARTGFFKIKGTANVLEVFQDGTDLGICP